MEQHLRSIKEASADDTFNQSANKAKVNSTDNDSNTPNFLKKGGIMNRQLNSVAPDCYRLIEGTKV